MTHFICYFNFDITSEEVEHISEIIFDVPRKEIGELLDERENMKVKYEIKNLDDNEKKGFFIELSLYLSSDLSSSVGIYNNLLLAYEVSRFMSVDVLISDESNDPYQWVLVKNTGRIFLVDEKEFENDYIILKENYKELFLSRALNLLPSINDVNKRLPAYFVDNPRLWLKAIKR